MDDVIIHVQQGSLRGKIGTDNNGRNYYQFLGIPYAKPPIGKLRFKAPQPADNWIGIRDATKDGSPCFLAMDDPNLNVPGNAGLKDMIVALKWVQANITSFGGDPNNVTIFGASAGGKAVHLLLLSPMAKGAAHCDDLAYLFNIASLSKKYTPNCIEDKTIRRMVTLWTNFAKTGDPNPIENVTWKPVTKSELNYLDINDTLSKMKGITCRNFFRDVNYKRLTQTSLAIRGILRYSTSTIEPIVKVEQGLLQGTTGIDYDNNKFYKFLGIPYAKPPVGELRFKAPQGAEKWYGIRDATKDGSASYSRDFFKGIIGSEDCLFLNIYTPNLPKNGVQLKPVMVWIHGGGFVWGSNDSQMYGPEFLITEDVVIVAVNYRLGILGFLSLEDENLCVPGNAGCKDMVMALKWVQRNIKQFGGDPNNVTIFGQSAGGTAVHLLTLSPMAKGLFHRAIAQSGAVLSTWSMCRPFQKYLKTILQFPYDKESDILKCLQELPVENLFQAQEKIRDRFYPQYMRYIGPTIEKISTAQGAFINQDPLDIIMKGNYTKVPLMMGYTSQEAFFLMSTSGKLSNKDKLYIDFERYVPHFLKLNVGSDMSKQIANKIKNFYFGENEVIAEHIDKYYSMQSDSIFVRGIHSSIKNHLLSSTEPIFLYRFSVDASLNLYKILRQINLPGASHADDLGYLFKSTFVKNIRPNSVEDKVIRGMAKLWTNFAKAGNPNPIKDALWKPVTRKELHFLDIGNEFVVGINPDQKGMQFWDEIFQLNPSTSRL
ncbi:carboxylesterase [Holotrichia oblita]|uniref:Carboxylesterase n=1 Tax=Holotrichia oblita TaxID=644536 RepID=A0ACB9TPZ0_HOLOL|nr:carboxylesterase [Holotrichia oblita]